MAILALGLGGPKRVACRLGPAVASGGLIAHASRTSPVVPPSGKPRVTLDARMPNGILGPRPQVRRGHPLSLSI